MKNVRWIMVIVMSVFVGAILGCSTSEHKAERIETTLNNEAVVSGDQTLGIRNGDLVVQRKVLMSEDLRKLQNEVYELEDHVYGTPKFGSKGIYGVLKDCHMAVADKANGGDGKMTFMEPVDRVTNKEDVLKIGLDETNKIIGLSEEYLKDRLTRFREYRQVLEKRQDDLEQKLDVCNLELKSNRYQANNK